MWEIAQSTSEATFRYEDLLEKRGEERLPLSPKRATSKVDYPIGVVSLAPMDGTWPSEVW
jgi:hypothetical protein